MSFSSLPRLAREARPLSSLAAPLARWLFCSWGSAKEAVPHIGGVNALHCCACICWAFGQLLMVYPLVYHTLLVVYRPGSLCLLNIYLI